MKGRRTERKTELIFTVDGGENKELFLISFDGLRGTKRPCTANGTLGMTRVVF